jgi:ADP-heptose:LPS heptosyltransferase
MLGPVSRYARALELVSRVYQLPLLTKPLRALPGLIRLRRARYDEVYLPFPATRWQYAFVARLIAAKALITHDYGGLSRAIARAGSVRLIPLRGGHRAFENLRLTSDCATIKEPAYEIPAAWRRTSIGGLLGLHFGTMVYKNNEARRWPIAKFVEVAEKQLDRGRRVRLFIGPAERDEAAAFSALRSSARFEIVDEPLDEAARMLSECRVFVANDAGFAHLAAALGVQTIALFGMTNPVRAHPLGRSLALRPSMCAPCHDEGLATFACVRDLQFRCTRDDFPATIVESAIEYAFTQGLPKSRPQDASDFRLYGRLQVVHQQ